jgi:glucosamine--fructose-6-phosphate aminotransferase (isomerizing)
MCGITGFIGEQNAYLQILSGLYQLQNRGYDSAGISIMENGELKTHKYVSTDNDSALTHLSEYKIQYSKSVIGIGHTRWATHGAKTDTNSHPHVSHDGLFSLVHNGIIENFQDIKAELLEKNIEMMSQTDTEVIVNLLSVHFVECGNVEESILKTTQQLKGTWGIAVLYKGEPNKIYCTRHGSPLLIGIDGKKAMITSEQSGFCNQFSKYIVLNNHDICVLTRDENGGDINLSTNDSYNSKPSLNVNVDLTPDPYPHWTIKEINEQIDASLRAISLGGRLMSTNEVKMGGLNEHVAELKEIDNIILLGCGTSYHAGMIGVHYLKEIGGFNSVQLFDGAEFGEIDIPKMGKTGLILLSQSGETKDLHRCIQIAQDRNLFMIGVVNVVDSLIAREVHCGCYLNAGREVAVASTKAYTSQVIVLSMIAIWFSQVKGTYELKRKQMMNDLRALYIDIYETIQLCETIICNEIVPLFKDKQSCFLLGKGKCESVAREGALKIKEISYIHAEGYSTSSLKHGPFALLEQDFPVILIAPDDEHYSKSMNAYEEIKSRHATIVVITDKKDCDIQHCITIPLNRTYRDMLSIIPLQILSYELSLDRGLNPDMPRNLAKVVTVE